MIPCGWRVFCGRLSRYGQPATGRENEIEDSGMRVEISGLLDWLESAGEHSSTPRPCRKQEMMMRHKRDVRTTIQYVR